MPFATLRHFLRGETQLRCARSESQKRVCEYCYGDWSRFPAKRDTWVRVRDSEPAVAFEAFVSASGAQDDLYDAANHDYRPKPAIRRLRT